MQPTDSKTIAKSKSKKTLLVLLVSWLTIIIALAIIYVSKNYQRSFSVSNDNNSPVALVNGTTITLERLNLAMSGIIQDGLLSEVDISKIENQERMRRETLETLIDSELIIQKSKELGLTVDPVKITNEMNLLESQFENRNAFLDKLKSVGLSELDIRNDIEKQFLITEYQNKIYDTSKDIVKESDIKIFYDALREKYLDQNQEPPSLEEAREKIILKILERRHQVFLEAAAKKLRENAKIEILI